MKKKLLSLALALALCLGLTVPTFAVGNDFTIENGVLTEYNGPGGVVTIPKDVTKIGWGAFQGCTNLRSVVIPEGVTAIGLEAFDGCTGLTSVSIPNSVTFIDAWAFSGCSMLTSVIIPESVTSISEFSFEFCSNLTSVTIPESVTKIGEYAFSDCSNLKTVYYAGNQNQWEAVMVAEGNSPLSHAAFRSTTQYASDFVIEDGVLIKYNGPGGAVTIPVGVKELGNDVFKNCTSLTNITIPKGVTRIGYDVFFGCENLVSVAIPDTVTYISHNAFWGCDSLTDVVIPGSVETTAGWAFYDCKNLYNATFLDGAQYIGEAVFGDCNNLSSVTIPASVTMIDSGAFSDCSRLKDVYYGGSETQWKKINIADFNNELCKATIHYNGSTSASASSSLGGFTDVKTSDYYADAVLWAVENKITSGTSKTTFSPGATCSKAQILTFLWRANGAPEPTAANPFTDIKPADYFYKAALWAAEKGLVSGSTFGANADCTRAMTVEYMWKAAGSPAPAGKADFDDVPASADYAQAVAWAVEQKITSGTGSSNFSPAATCTRGQIVTFLHRAMGK